MITECPKFKQTRTLFAYIGRFFTITINNIDSTSYIETIMFSKRYSELHWSSLDLFVFSRMPIRIENKSKIKYMQLLCCRNI